MKKFVFLLAILFVFAGCNGKSGTPSAYQPIQYKEAAAGFIEKDDLLCEEDIQDLSNYIRVLHNCGVVPFSRIVQVEEVKELERGFYRVECVCDNQIIIIDATQQEDSLRNIAIWMIYEKDEKGPLYYPIRNQEERYFTPEDSRQNSLSVLEEHCRFTKEEAFRLMREIDMIYGSDRIDFFDIASIEQVKQHKSSVSLSLTSNYGKLYNVDISTVSRPIILSITDSKGSVLYASEEL
jgi:hypothetical protein